jgi:Holliday junction DNA helicase RuvA
MIASLSGNVLSKGTDRAIVDVRGVGYELLVAADTIARMPEKGETVFLYVHTNVREDAISLYGFVEEEEKELFLILKTVSGIGPKLALGMLSGLRVADICEAIGAGDIKRLMTLQGVGKKTAERICVDLKEKVSHLGGGAAVSGEAPLGQVNTTTGDVLSALTNLGYPESTARSAVSKVKKQAGDKDFDMLSVEDLIREALRTLA